MQIASVTPHHLRVTGDAGELDIFLIELGCAEMRAWGEARVYSAQDLVDGVALVAPLLLDRDPLDRGVLGERCADALVSSRPDAALLAGCLGAVDMALWDLTARALGQPLRQLLGGSHLAAIEAAPVLALGHSRSVLAARAQELCSQGFTALRVEIGANPSAGVDAVHAIRRAAGAQMRIVVDVDSVLETNGAALEVGAGLAQADAYWIEDLLAPGAYADWAAVCRTVLSPVGGGKPIWKAEEAIACLRAHGVDILTPDLCLCGGVTGASRLAQFARAEGIRLAIWPGLTPLATLTAAHLSLATPTATPLLPVPDRAVSGLLSAELTVRDGLFVLPGGPGIGAEVDGAFVEAHSQALPEAGV
jgi:D-galactarolactone cycloisomerase